MAVMSLKKKAVLQDAVSAGRKAALSTKARYRTKTIPAAGALLKEEDSAEKQANV